MSEEFANDLVQAEFSHMTNDSGNPWSWKKGDELHRWTDDTYWTIEKVDKYPECGITLKQR